MYYIYEMRHTPTGRVYVGQRKLPKGKTPETDDYMGSGKIWKNIYKAHPEECVKTVLEFAENREEANELERKYIAHYRNVYGNLCVNLADGGHGGFTGTCSEETRRKISEAQKGEKHHFFGKHHSEETRRKLSEALSGEKNHNFGKRFSEETRRKLSEALSGEKHPFFGKQHSEETKKKISEAHKGEKHPFFGKHHSEETRRKMSETRKGRTPWNKGKHHSEEHKRKISESLSGEKNHNYGKHITQGRERDANGRFVKVEKKGNS